MKELKECSMYLNVMSRMWCRVRDACDLVFSNYLDASCEEKVVLFPVFICCVHANPYPHPR